MIRYGLMLLVHSSCVTDHDLELGSLTRSLAGSSAERANDHSGHKQCCNQQQHEACRPSAEQPEQLGEAVSYQAQQASRMHDAPWKHEP